MSLTDRTMTGPRPAGSDAFIFVAVLYSDTSFLLKAEFVY